MTREDEIIEILSVTEASGTLLGECERLEEVAFLLRQKKTKYRQKNYDTILAGLNYEITEATGFTSETDLTIARQLISDEVCEQQYLRYTEGTY